MGLLSSLNRKEKETIGLLQIGTFLEYFDLMLYVHMAVLLNELFFPPADPQTASLQTAFAFCSAYVFRPIGALIFGWIGDHIGRKRTIVVTTAMMAVSCLIMANLPTYAQMGIWAAWIVTICRMLQGMSSMGEIVGAEIYLTETFDRPVSYPIVASLSIATGLGGMAALGIATLVTSSDFSWRLAFWIGAGIAVVGAFARTRLRETPEFLKMKRKWLREQVHEMNLAVDPIEGARVNATWKEPVKGRTLISLFFILCGWPLSFYLAFLYFNPVLKETFGYSSIDIIRHNFSLSVIYVIVCAVLTYLSSRVHPVKILKVRGVFFLFFIISTFSL